MTGGVEITITESWLISDWGRKVIDYTSAVLGGIAIAINIPILWLTRMGEANTFIGVHDNNDVENSLENESL